MVVLFCWRLPKERLELIWRSKIQKTQTTLLIYSSLPNNRGWNKRSYRKNLEAWTPLFSLELEKKYKIIKFVLEKILSFLKWFMQFCSCFRLKLWLNQTTIGIIMPFWGFRADFKRLKGGSKSAQNPLKRHNAIETRLKKRGSITHWSYLKSEILRTRSI